MSELLLCPFCRGEAELLTFWDFYKFSCKNADCQAHVADAPYVQHAEGVWYGSIGEARAAWNTRADDYRQAAEYWKRMYEEAFAELTCHEVMVDKFFRGCSECGYMWEYMYGIGKRERPNYCPNCGAKVLRNASKYSETDAKVVGE